MDIDPRLLGQRRVGADRKLGPARELELVRDYLNGTKLRVLQAEYQLSKQGVYGVLHRHGIDTTRGRGANAA